MFHHTLCTAGFDKVTDAEGIVHQKEYARDDIFYQGLGAGTYGQADHSGAGNQWTNVDTHRRQNNQCNDDKHNGKHELT